ncbi:MAG: MobF family relaxase, partial [Ilumatobacteraceae bacterium]
MLRVTTLYASSAAATAAYYAHYLTMDPGEEPGVWRGRQADGLGLAVQVRTEDLELLLSGRDPVSGTWLGSPLVDRCKRNGKVIHAVAGFDATFSAPKSLSVWWALTGDTRLLDAHDIAVAAALGHLERFGSTTRRRRDGRMLFADTGGLTMATFRQTTSRLDDPQLHTHAVVSAKVQTEVGRWYALNGHYIKQHQRMLGGLYQSVLRAELTPRFGVGWLPVVKGQAEIAGVPTELLAVFSKRTSEIDAALTAKVAEFRQREGRGPSRFERAAMEREAAKDTRRRKSGNGVADLTTRWQAEAAAIAWTPDLLRTATDDAGREAGLRLVDGLTIGEIVEAMAAKQSSWCRADVVKTLCDVLPAVSHISGHRWHDLIEQTADKVLSRCIDLDPPNPVERRASDGRSVWIEPTAAQFSSDEVLAQEEHIVTWAMAAQATEPTPSTTVERGGLDVAQHHAAASVAGHDGVVLVVGPAGTGKTRMLAAGADALAGHGRVVFGLAPTAKAARVLERDTRMPADTVAKLLHERRRTDRPPAPPYRLPTGATVIVDEASMISTPDLYQLVRLAETWRWRLVLVGDHRQLQAVGRGGLFAELCVNGRVDELDQLHRFARRWEA